MKVLSENGLDVSILPSPIAVLSARELEVLRMIVLVDNNKKAARLMGLSGRTVEIYRLNIRRKLGHIPAAIYALAWHDARAGAE